MKIQTGETYQSSQFAKILAASEAKVGKTSYLVASALGVLPWQKEGGIVDDPRHMHILTFDANAAGGLAKFLTQTCGAPKEALQFKVYNLQDDMRKTSVGDGDYDTTFYAAVLQALDMIAQSAKGVPFVLMSSLTGLAQGLERGIVGPPRTQEQGNVKGYSDPSKWKMLAHQINEVRNFAQVDNWHVAWEAHIDKPASMQVGKDGGDAPKETISVSGQAGRNFGYNVEQVFRIYRQYGSKYSHPSGEKTNCDLVYLNTRPMMDFIASGRGFTENLNEKEYDPTAALRKLGVKIGHWGAKTAAPKPVAKPAVAKKV
jgi:hypothetical protein